MTSPCSATSCVTPQDRIYTINIKIRQDTLQVGGLFTVVTNAPTYDIGSGSYTNDNVFIAQPFSSMSTTTNTGCAKVVGSTLCQLIVSFTTVNSVPSLASGGRIIV
jgi:hypothetical protein